jgi:hypothetical protein
MKRMVFAFGLLLGFVSPDGLLGAEAPTNMPDRVSAPATTPRPRAQEWWLASPLKPPVEILRLPEVVPRVTHTAIAPPKVQSPWFGSTLTLVNQASSPALVRVVGPKTEDVEVPAGSSRKTNVPHGDYIVRIRFGTSKANYTYSQGEAFSVTDTPTTYSENVITFNSVTGNYETVGISEAEFWR